MPVTERPRDERAVKEQKELCALRVDALAHGDAVLFCWATFPLLPDALTVVAGWGFEPTFSF